jgi:hypothetical protein
MIEVVDEAGAPIVGARIVVPQSGSSQPVEADAAGQYAWPDLPGPDAAVSLSAPGYFATDEPLTLERGLTEKTVKLQRDPLGLTATDACAPDEKLLNIEDFQAGAPSGGSTLAPAPGASRRWRWE